jgi:aspartate racemase
VQVIVLGCTELPLLLRDAALACPAAQAVRFVDPTDVLARRCVAYALGASGALAATPDSAAAGAGRLRVERVFG